MQAVVPGVGCDDVVDGLRRPGAVAGLRARLAAGGRAQGLGPLHDFRVDARRLVAFAQRHQHDRGGVLAGVAHRARAVRFDQPALADLGEHRGVGDEADVDLIGLRGAALDDGLDAVGLQAQPVHSLQVVLRLAQGGAAEQLPEVGFGVAAGGLCGGHLRFGGGRLAPWPAVPGAPCRVRPGGRRGRFPAAPPVSARRVSSARRSGS